MANKPWFQANIHAPGTGFALLVIAFCLLLQTIPSAICVLTPKTGWHPPLSPERVRYCKGEGGGNPDVTDGDVSL